MPPSSPGLADIVIHTPIWVWPLLALLIWRGLRNTQPRETDMGGPILLPLLLSVLSAHGLLTGAFTAMVALGLVLGGAAGVATGRRLESRHPAQLVAPGRLLLPGDWTSLAIILVAFCLGYGRAVLGAVQPAALANPMVQLSSTTITAFIAAVLLTRMVMRLNRLRQTSLTA